MFLLYDFISTNLNPHLNVKSILNLRMTAKYFNCYNILESHQYIRKLKNIKDILDYINNPIDKYQLSLCIEPQPHIINKIHIIMKQKPIYSIKIIEDSQIDTISSFGNNTLNDILDDGTYIQSLRYISMNYVYFCKFSTHREKIILKVPLGLDFDTFHINLENGEMEDLNYIIPYLNQYNYPSLKNIILDNIILDKYDITIFREIFINNNNILIGNTEIISPDELNYCQEFVVDEDYRYLYQLNKTEFICLNEYDNDIIDYKIYIYYYCKETSINLNHYSIQWYNNLHYNNQY